MEEQNKGWSRRKFLGASALGMTGLAVLPGMIGCTKPESELKIGFIGLGRQGMFLLDGFLTIPGVTAVAACDVYGIKRKRFERRVNAFYTKAGKSVKVETYEKYGDLLKREDTQAVVIAVPDHSHAYIAIAALKAGKDVYLEKPMTFTIKEGQELRKVVRETGRIFGLGSQQRSDPNFQNAVNLVQTGAIGKITNVKAYVGAPPKPYDLPEEPLPADLNWDLWLGPLPTPIHYNQELDPIISLDPEVKEKTWGGWRWYKGMAEQGKGLDGRAISRDSRQDRGLCCPSG